MSTATLLNESPSRFESVVSTVPSQPARRELRALTGLRFVAAFAVVIYHFSSVFAARWPAALRRLADSGYISVDLFFLLSGFVLAYGYLGDRPAMRGTKRAFWSARFARIYPAYLLAFLLAIPANVIGESPRELSPRRCDEARNGCRRSADDGAGMDTLDSVVLELPGMVCFS